MKRFLIFMVLIMVASSSFTTLSAKEDNGKEWGFGAKVNLYSGWNGMIGLGGYARYDISQLFRLEPSLVILCDEGTSIDLSVDLHMPMELSSAVELYPLVGLSLNDPGKLGLGVNLGGGLGYSISQKVNVDFGIKWMIASQKYYNNPLIFSLGCGFKF